MVCPEKDEIIAFCNVERGRVLDIGCSYGRVLLPLAKSGFYMVGIDVASEPLKVLKEKAKRLANVEVCQAAFTKLPFIAASFSGCVAINSLYHGTSDDVAKAVREIERVLIPDGWFYGTFLAKEDWKYMQGIPLEEDTFLACGGSDANVPHWFADKTKIEQIFSKWQIASLKQEKTKIDGNISVHWKVIAHLYK